MTEGKTESTGLALKMVGMGKSFGPTRVLDGVDFDAFPGEVHVLAGENGAGKSTLIKILAGVHLDYDGEILLNGEARRFHSPQDANACGISVIYQELSLIPAMRVMDNIFLGRERAGRGGWMRFRQQNRKCRQLLKDRGLRVHPLRPVEVYPVSVQQQIEIAKALAFDARIIVMDEPTSALTAPEVETLFQTMDELKAQGCAIIYISHKMEEIYRVADRITVLRDGRGVGSGTAAEIPRGELVRLMVGRAVDEQYVRDAREPESSGTMRLDVRGLTVRDPEGRPQPAVRDVSFSARPGEVVGFGGLQGSGASTLFEALFGACRHSSGEITLNGESYKPDTPGSAIARGVALLTSDRKGNGLVLDMDLTRNITLASLARFSPRGWMHERKELATARRHREALGIRAASMRQAVETLSGGNQQKVVLAKWIETRPQLLLLDEPTRGVDVGAKQEIYRLIDGWTREGITILLITSEMPELLALSDRILVMHRGSITAELSKEEATQARVLEAAMGAAEAAI
jgi:ABC-type sugar transport system ATPase subunit